MRAVNDSESVDAGQVDHEGIQSGERLRLMRDDEVRALQAVDARAKMFDQHGPRRAVDGAEGFVKREARGAGGERTGEVDAGDLSSGEVFDAAGEQRREVEMLYLRADGVSCLMRWEPAASGGDGEVVFYGRR